MQPERTRLTRVLGIDTSVRSSGVAVVEARGSLLSSVEYGRITNRPAVSLSQCLLRIYGSIGELITRSKPQAAAIEGIFFCKNVKTAVMLGEARGAVIAACAAAQVPVYEYSPLRVKQAVTGFGKAGKEQVRKMVMALLKLAKEPCDDESDALALAICHIHTRVRWQESLTKEI